MEDLTKFVPADCGDNDYCEDSLDYPDEESLMEIVRNMSDTDLVQLLFRQIGVLTKQPSKVTKGRPKNPDDEYELIFWTSLCHTVESFVFPKTAKTRSSQWRWSHASKHNFFKYLHICDQPAFS